MFLPLCFRVLDPYARFTVSVGTSLQLLSAGLSWQHRITQENRTLLRIKTNLCLSPTPLLCRYESSFGYILWIPEEGGAKLFAWCCFHGWIYMGIRNKIFCLWLKFECCDFLQGILLVIFEIKRSVNNWELSSADFLADFVSFLDWLSLIKLQKFHPL